jgi:transcriptional regulator with XRE-family HTH domain
MKTYNDEALNRLFSEITPEEQAKTDAKMLLAVKIADAMKTKNWNNKRLMKEMGKTNQSEITRWLSGTQNFTVETLVDLERVLDIKLLQLQDNKPTIKTIQQYKIDILVPFTRNEQNSSFILSEPDETFSYYKQTIHS